MRDCIPQQSDYLDADLDLCGAIVPHAGWACSGKVTGKVFKALADRTNPQTVVLIGAVHAVRGRQAALFDEGAWETPIGQVAVDAALAKVLLSAAGLIESDQQAHQAEHSLEVQVPFVQTLFPEAKILPVMVPPSALASGIGEAIGSRLAEQDVPVIVVGTSDLTHYGPGYGLTSHGVGQEGLDWAKNANDRRMIDRILAMDVEGVVPEAAQHQNACGGGAIAATIAACKALHARRAILLEHTTSAETLTGLVPGPVTDAVGYAGIVFCK